jgi:hypothetical protein
MPTDGTKSRSAMAALDGFRPIICARFDRLVARKRTFLRKKHIFFHNFVESLRESPIFADQYCNHLACSNREKRLLNR